MALVKRGDQLSVSTVQQSTTESKGKGYVKVLDEETYVQVSVFRKVYTVMSFVCIIGKKLREKFPHSPILNYACTSYWWYTEK